VLAVDTPLLNASTLRHLVAAAEPVSIYSDNSPLPCVLHRSESLIKYVRSLLLDPNQKAAIRQVLRYANAQTMALKHEELFNANTPTDWQHCRQQLQTRYQHG